ncbi:hypothetical protein [Thiopseudomonas denitrificans]|nr:hypothetical protein [Thiopseudomonas denitrificans]
MFRRILLLLQSLGSRMFLDAKNKPPEQQPYQGRTGCFMSFKTGAEESMSAASTVMPAASRSPGVAWLAQDVELEAVGTTPEPAVNMLAGIE